MYERHLQAVPFSSGSNQKENTRTNNGAREMIEKKIEPWFRRELEAILGDPDPSVLVLVGCGFLIIHISSLQDSALMNQHLLFFRCFAESPFTMETYDTVVEYRKCSG